MRLSWNEVRARAAAFAEDWKDAAYEKGETQSEPPRVYRRVKLSKDEPYDTTQTYPVLYG